MKLSIKFLPLVFAVATTVNAIDYGIIGGEENDIKLCTKSLSEYEYTCSDYLLTKRNVDQLCENSQKPVCSVPMQNKYQATNFQGCDKVNFSADFDISYTGFYYAKLKFACDKNDKGERCPFAIQSFRLDDNDSKLTYEAATVESIKNTCSDPKCTEYTKEFLKNSVESMGEIIEKYKDEYKKNVIFKSIVKTKEIYSKLLNSIENNNCIITEDEIKATSDAISLKMSTYLLSVVGLLVMLYLH